MNGSYSFAGGEDILCEERMPVAGVPNFMGQVSAVNRVDQAHIEDLISVALIDEALVANLPDDLRARLGEIEATREQGHG